MNFVFGLSIQGYDVIGIFWNVLLILIPCFVVYGLQKAIRNRQWGSLSFSEKSIFVILFFYWLFWFPNTVYQFMLPRHLVHYCDYYDEHYVCSDRAWLVAFFFIYALLGAPAFYYALSRMAELWNRLFSASVSRLMVWLTLPITTLGLMLGLFDRANSWEVITRPLALIQVVFGYLADPDTLFFFFFFTLCLFFVYYGFALILPFLNSKK